MKLNCKHILFVAWSEYIKWLINPRMIVLLVILVPIREQIILPMLQAAREMGQPLNLFEPCIAAANSGLIIFLLPLAYIVLISSFPTVDGNMLFYIKRMGRKNWIIGEILFIVFSTFTYCIMVIAAVSVQTAHQAFVANGWSIPATDYEKLYGDISNIRMDFILPPNLYFQMSPYKAFFLSYFLLFLFLLFCSFAFLAGCLYAKKLLFFFLVILQIAAGSTLYRIENNLMWYFPVSHSILRAHYRNYLRKYVFPPGLSIGLLTALLVVLFLISYRKAKKVSLDRIGGDILS